MRRVLFGNKSVGVQGIYYFEDHSFVEDFAAKIKPFLDSLREGTDYWQQFMDEWKHEKLLYNFLCELKRRVGLENDSPEVWWEPGGSLYGEKWHNVELPNGNGKCYLGDKLIESDDDDEINTTEPGEVGLKLCLYKLANGNVISTDEFESILNRIKSHDSVRVAWKELADRLSTNEDEDDGNNV